ncbi:MAG: D-glycero-alpha-D-manno-heptose-1,7-bisphosphate 7-phosphatase [Bacteriovoracaceae bacterium]
MKKRAVFLDRDGVINQTIFKMGKPRAPYNLEEFSFLPGVEEAVEFLREEGFELVIVTNQPDVARGWVTREAVDLVNDYISERLGIRDVRACFHTEHENCDCRKPEPGMLLAAARDRELDLESSFMVGDRISDIEAGKRAGCKTILISNTSEEGNPDHVAPTLLAATGWIVEN